MVDIVCITANYRLGSHDYSNPQQSSFSQGVGFSVGCNGAGGSYALYITNQTFQIGGNPSTIIAGVVMTLMIFNQALAT